MARIFLAEDEISVRMLLIALAKGAGHEVVGEAGSVQEAKQKLTSDGIQLEVAILDGNMPNEGDGANLAQTIRYLFPGAKVFSYAGQEETFGDENFMKPNPANLLRALGRIQR